jgi:hypothetical protein
MSPFANPHLPLVVLLLDISGLEHKSLRTNSFDGAEVEHFQIVREHVRPLQRRTRELVTLMSELNSLFPCTTVRRTPVFHDSAVPLNLTASGARHLVGWNAPCKR